MRWWCGRLNIGRSPAEGLLQGLPQGLFLGVHAGHVQVPRIAFVNVKCLDRGQVVCALNLPGQRLELGMVHQRDAHGPPAGSLGWLGLGGFPALQLHLHAQGSDGVALPPASPSFEAWQQ